MLDIANTVSADDPPRVVDTPGSRALRRRRIVEGGEGIDWHDTGSIVSVAEKRRSGSRAGITLGLR